MSKSSWLFRNKPVVAAACGTQDYGRFLFSVYYDVSKSEASCTLNGKCGIDGFANEQLISLVLRPEQILALTSNGAVQCPAAILPLPFTDPLASDFVAFSNLCQTTAVDVYIGKSQLSLKQLEGLEDFTDRLSPRPLCSNAIDLRRLRGGRGAQEAQWADVHQQSPVHQTDPGAQQEYVIPNAKRHRAVACTKAALREDLYTDQHA
ncbi:hypothetical protein E4T52_17389 [Aureobasidium sp. EXF-3400]|nr:hypothetical protein E4T51_16603 [Aureobasidium sp. EXF-12344]KAI4767429.1 hypothetical protein E4T52_17389 [Aureobasidium sp. EXF-3400]